MENLASPEHDARVRLTHDQAQELVLRTVATQAESLLRTAHRHSLCDDDAHDAYQRSMEIFLRRARTLDPASAHKWLHVVVKREAQELRRSRSGSVPYEAVDFELHAAPDTSTPEERALTVDRTTRAAEALRRLKPQELRALWLKALGHSYADALGHEAPAAAATLALTYAPAPAPGAGLPPAPSDPPSTSMPTPAPDPPAPDAFPPSLPKPAPKASPALRIASLRHRGRRILLTGTLSRHARAGITIRFRVSAGRRTVTRTVAPRPRAGAFHASFTLPRSLARARSATVVVRYRGDARTAAATRRATVRWHG